MTLKAVLVALAIVAVGKAQEIDKDEGLYVLNTKNYEKATNGETFTHLLVMFYAPWCGHCKALIPEFVKAAALLREKDSPIKLAKIDGTEEEDMLRKMHVEGYPTIFYYRQGDKEPIKYNGGRMANEIVGWVEKKVGPAAEVLDDADKVKDFLDDKEVAVIGFFKDQASDQARAYLKAVRDFEDYPCAITSGEAAMEANGGVADGQVVLFKKFDEGRAVYEGAIGTEALQEFIHRYAVPLVVEFNHETAQKIFKGLVKSHILFFISKTSDVYESKVSMIRSIAEEFRHRLMFVVVDLDEDDNRRVIEFLGLKGETMPTMRIIQMKEDIIKYKPEDASYEESNIRRFVGDFLEEKVPVHYLSQDLPDDWDKNPVKILTGKNFDSVAFDKSKSVLVEFYAPWCGHCKQLSPIWDKLAESLEDKEDIVVAKMDSTVNELPHTRVRSFPTIKLYAKGDNEQHEYNGERTLEGIAKFLSTNGEYGKAAPDHDEL